MVRLMSIVMLGLILMGCFGGEVIEPYELMSPNDCGILLNENPRVLLVDVRTAGEYQGGYIKGAINLPLDELSSLTKTYLPDKEQTIMIYCKTGKRSGVAVEELLALGYLHLIEMEGGVNSWKGILVKGEG